MIRPGFCAAIGAFALCFSAALAPAQETFTVSGTLKKWNNSAVVKFDRATGDLLVAWSQGDIKKNAAGAIYVARFTRNEDGTYAGAAPILLSEKSAGQRPSLVFLPATDQWLVAWDNGPRDILADAGAAPAGQFASAGIDYRTFRKDSTPGELHSVFNADFLYGYPQLTQYQAGSQGNPPVNYDWVFMGFSCIQLDGGGGAILETGAFYGQTFGYGSNGSYFSGVQRPILSDTRGYATSLFVDPDRQVHIAYNDIIGHTLPEKRMEFKALRVDADSAVLNSYTTVYQRPGLDFGAYSTIFPIDGKKSLVGYTTYAGLGEQYGLFTMPRQYTPMIIPAGPRDILAGAMVDGSISITYDRDPRSIPAPPVKASNAGLVFRLNETIIALRNVSVKGKPIGSRIDLASANGIIDYDADYYEDTVAVVYSAKVSKKNSKIILRLVPLK